METVEDLVGGLVPDEWFRVVVPGFDPVVEICGECGDALVCGSLQQLAGEFTEPAFYEIQPAAAGGCEMKREPRVAQ